MEQKRPRRPTHAEDEELAAITREIHAQLRALYPEKPAAIPAAAPVRRRAQSRPPDHLPPLSPRLIAGRALAAFVLPPLLMLALALLLHAMMDG